MDASDERPSGLAAHQLGEVRVGTSREVSSQRGGEGHELGDGITVKGRVDHKVDRRREPLVLARSEGVRGDLSVVIPKDVTGTLPDGVRHANRVRVVAVTENAFVQARTHTGQSLSVDSLRIREHG